jgi:Flp pilus assembly protein TadB
MIEAICFAAAVLVGAAAVRPRPSPRRVAAAPPHPRKRLVIHWPRRKRTQPPTAAEVASWCDGLARSVRSGSTLTAALQEVETAPSIRTAVDDLVLALRRGRPLTDALTPTSTSSHLQLAYTVLRACAEHGGPPAEPLDRAAATLRSRAAIDGERATQSAQARLSALVMTILPGSMLVLLLITSSPTRSAALSPAGMATITTGGLLNLAGWRWMRHIIVGATE